MADARAGDPWVVWGSRENAYFSCLAAAGPPTGVLVSRSDDGGRSWSEPLSVPRGGGGSFDHTSLAVWPRPDSGDVVYMAGMQGLRSDDRPPISAPFVAVSTDGARSFRPPHRVVTSNVMANALNPVVLGPGAMGVAFVDFSVDGGRSFRDPVTVSSEDFCARTGEVAGAGRWRVGGDYFGLAATGDGVFRVLWADSRTGVWGVRTAQVRCVDAGGQR